MIVDVNEKSTDDHPSVYLYSYTEPYDTRAPQPATSMPLTQSGKLKKLIIAGEFDVTVSAGWPELQIIRNATDVVFTTSTAEPKPTGYLNVYEYDISTDKFEIKAGDVLNISWHMHFDVEYLNWNRFSLAYYNTGTSSDSYIPMVSLVVGDCDPEVDLLTLNTLYCENTTVTTSGNGRETTTMHTTYTSSLYTQTNLSVVIGMVMSCSLIIILLILVITCVIVIIRRRKKFAIINNVDSTGMNRYATTSEINSYLQFVSISHVIFSRE